jgi:hypothetical protein
VNPIPRAPIRVRTSWVDEGGCGTPWRHSHGDLDCCARHSLAPHASMAAVHHAILLSVSACSRCVVYPLCLACLYVQRGTHSIGTDISGAAQKAKNSKNHSAEPFFFLGLISLAPLTLTPSS